MTEAVGYLEEALAIWRQLADERGTASATRSLAQARGRLTGAV